MARKGSVKALSIEQEDYIARVYDGVRSKSSGASDTDGGDVRSEGHLFECKLKGGPGTICEEHSRIDCKECMRVPVLVQQMEKVAVEAYAEGRDPVVCLRFYAPHSILSDPRGWVDFTVRLTKDDI